MDTKYTSLEEISLMSGYISLCGSSPLSSEDAQEMLKLTNQDIFGIYERMEDELEGIITKQGLRIEIE